MPIPEFKVETSANPAWVLDYLDLNKLEFIEDMNVDRRGLSVFILALFVTLVFFVFKEINSAIFLFFTISESFLCVTFINLQYNKNAKVKAKKILLSQKKKLHENHSHLDRKTKEINTQLLKIKIEEKEINAALNQRANQIAQTERNELSFVDLETTRQWQSLIIDIRKMNEDEAEEFRSSLLTLQQDYIDNHLSNFQLADASIEGIGNETQKSLVEAGISTAAEILDCHTVVATSEQQNKLEIVFLFIKENGWVQINGLRPAEARSLIEWRGNLEQQFKLTAPIVVPSEVSAQIRSKYEDKRVLIHNEILNSKPEANQIKRNIFTKYKNELEQNRNQAKRLNRYFSKKKNDLEEAMAKQVQEINKANMEQDSLNKKLLAYKKINLFYYLKRILQV